MIVIMTITRHVHGFETLTACALMAGWLELVGGRALRGV